MLRPENTLPPHWLERLALLDYAFQPIVLYTGGIAYGFEALLRGWDRAGFASIATVFDRAYAEGVLYALDLALRRKAFRKFEGAEPGNAKIFYNVDNRLLQLPGYATSNTLRIAEETGLSPSRIVFELSELHEPDCRSGFDRVVAAYRNQGFRIALDDFGSGYAGLKLLHRAEPDIVKVDRYFVSGAADEPRKAAFLEKIAGLAHLMGITVVAEGVETEKELRLCAEAGCDMVQGFFIARPSVEIAALSERYEAVAFSDGERRSTSASGRVGADSVVVVEPVGLDADLVDVLARFRKDSDAALIPLVNGEGEPLGVYRERDFRQYVYSPFGIALLEHLTVESGATALLAKAPIAPLGSELSRIVECFGASSQGGGVILTSQGRYAGVLPAEKLLALVAERELAEARDQNPLTRLPGNLRVAEVCARKLAEPGPGAAFAYFDFDNFKPFNDRYGFRNGDRIIMLFADILKSTIRRPPGFIGHLGGDDFFAHVEAPDAEALAPIAEAAERFSREAVSFYTAEDRERGWIPGKDRDGNDRKLPLLTVSAAIVVLKPGAQLDSERLSEVLAELKKQAKVSAERRALRVFEPHGQTPQPEIQDEAQPRRDRQSGSRDSSQPPVFPVFTPALIAAS